MKILVSNDDGYQAPGIICLVEKLQQFATVTVVAPDRNRSGASHSLTLDQPLHAKVADNGFIHVDGTPTDCVHLAVTGLLDIQPDIVVSGINAGANLGDDVMYSGTVAAAMEGRFLGLPALAVSLVGDDPQHYATAAHVIELFLNCLQTDILALPTNTILNINVPDRPWQDIKGIHATRLGSRHRASPIIKGKDPRGRQIYWLGAVGPEQDAGPGTDFYAINQGAVSVTPLHVDLTNYTAMGILKPWLAPLHCD